MAKQFPGKLLLFGEYTIIGGSLALAIPYPYYIGQFEFVKKGKENNKIVASQGALFEISKFLKRQNFNNFLDTVRFEKELSEGLWFNSSIPLGYGCGSSGALCAAIYDRYHINAEESIQLLKERLAAIESFFHGQSSGIDPLVCYLQQGLITNGKDYLIKLRSSVAKNRGQLFLLDTGISRQTTALVKTYQTYLEQPEFHQNFVEPISVAVEQAIHKFQSGDSLLTELKLISVLQYQHMGAMIPQPYKETWENGWKDELYYLKLCGAGGGGYILGYTEKWKKTSQALKAFKIHKID